MEYTDFDPQNKFVSPNDSDTWVRTIKHGKEEIHMALSYLTDEEAATVSGLYPEWKPDTRYQTGERAAYQDMLYRARQDHTSDGQYPPDTVPALWDMIPLAE